MENGANKLNKETKDICFNREELNEYINNILLSMDYSFRIPLNSILGYSYMLSQGIAGPISDKQSQYVNHVITSGEELLAFTNNLSSIIDLVKIDLDLNEYCIEKFDIREALDQVVAIKKPDYDKKGVILKVFTEYKTKMIVSDKQHFKKILTILLANTLNITEETNVVLLNLEDDSEDKLILSIIDNGNGYKAEHMKNIFPEIIELVDLWQKSISIADIGMTVVKRLLAKLQCEITVESTYGEGAAFYLKIPTKISTINNNIPVD